MAVTTSVGDDFVHMYVGQNIQQALGYRNFFLWVLLAALPVLLLSRFVRLEGTRAAPVMTGTTTLRDARYRETRAPDVDVAGSVEEAIAQSCEVEVCVRVAGAWVVSRPGPVPLGVSDPPCVR